MIWLWLLMALVLDRVHLKLSTGTYGSPYCGLGTVDPVNSRQAESPMAYRTLLPWLIALVERIIPGLKAHRLPALYEPLRILIMAAALAAIAQAVSPLAALIVAVLLGVTFYFDYWDWAVELLGLALALTGNPGAALIGGLLLGASRETAPLVAVTYVLITGDVGQGLQILGATLAVMLAVRLWAGRKPLYCERWMGRVNLDDVRELFQNRPFYLSEIAMTLLVTGLTLWAVLSGNAGPAWPVPLALLAAGWLMARAAETRVFTGCLLWVAIALVRVL